MSALGESHLIWTPRDEPLLSSIQVFDIVNDLVVYLLSTIHLPYISANESTRIKKQIRVDYLYI